jgi:phosphate transport system protein
METETTFQKRLQETQQDVVIMGSMVEKAIGNSVEALKKRNLTLAHQVVADDSKINEQRFTIEDKCIGLLDTKQAVVIDLRIIVAILNIISELERIGDYAEGIAKVAILIGNEPPLKPLIDIPRMSEIVIEMINKSLQSFISRDVELAKKVISLDDTVDALNDQIFRELLTFMMLDAKTITRAARLMWVGHNLERAADRTTNICERVAFLIKGKVEELGASKY